MSRLRRRATDEGFTLVELLVVMVIIAVLASIAVPMFLTQRQKAADAALQTDLRTLALHEETYYTDHEEYLAFAASTSPQITDTIRLSAGTSASAEVNAAGQAYCLRITSDRASQPRVHISSKGGLQPPTVSTCPAAPNY